MNWWPGERGRLGEREMGEEEIRAASFLVW